LNSTLKTLKGFTLIEAMIGVLITAISASAIMMGVSSVNQSLKKVRVKEKAYEALRDYTDFLKARIMAEGGSAIGSPSQNGDEVILFENDQGEPVYIATVNYHPIRKLSDQNSLGEVYSLDTYIVWDLNENVKDTIEFNTAQIRLQL